MTVSELHEISKELMAEGRGDCVVQVNALSGRLCNNSNVDITHVGMGIDWDSKRCLVQTKETLLTAQLAEKRAGRKK